VQIDARLCQRDTPRRPGHGHPTDAAAPDPCFSVSILQGRGFRTRGTGIAPAVSQPYVLSFTAHFAAKYRKIQVDIAPEALQALSNYPWPGNISKLENAPP
jgi:hypothetical protein